MWLLALETTTREGSVALLRDDDVVAARPGDPALSHAERLPADFAAVLAVAGLAPSAIDLFAVATGPGGFTGLRIGLAAVQGLALSLDRPVAGVASLPALAWAAFDVIRRCRTPACGSTPRAGKSSPRPIGAPPPPLTHGRSRS